MPVPVADPPADEPVEQLLELDVDGDVGVVVVVTGGGREHREELVDKAASDSKVLK